MNFEMNLAKVMAHSAVYFSREQDPDNLFFCCGGGDPPAAPDYAAANREGIMTDIETLPLRKQIERAATMGLKISYTDPSSGEEKSADFTGMGDIDQSRDNLAFMGEAADLLAEKQIENEEKFGLRYIEQREKERRAADPRGAEVRDKLGDAAMEDLDAGYDLPEGLRRDVVQQERAGQAARGNIFGQAPAAAEAMSVGDAAFRLRQQRLANASSFLSGTTPISQFQQISGSQNGASPFNPMQIQQGIGQNANAGSQAASFAQNNYSTESRNWAVEQQNSPFNKLSNMFTGALGKAAGGGVASKLFG